jgi:hypothetical protein
MLKSLITDTLKISKVVICYLSIFFLYKVNDSYAFGGGSSMGFGGMPSSGGAGTKSGMSIVDPEGKAYNCEAFVDKKWESSSHEDNWNGIYFSIGGEASKLSGGLKIESSTASYSTGNTAIPTFSEVGVKKGFTGESSMPIVTVGGGFLVDKIYLATDVEARFLPFDFQTKAMINDGGKNIEKTLTYSLQIPLVFNAKIGYLLSKRSMVYFNAGIASLSSSSIEIDNTYDVIDQTEGAVSAPIRLSLGTEFLLSNHFRLLADYSYWIMPQDMNSFELKKSGPSSINQSDNAYVADFKISSLKLGIMYRF